MLHERPSSALDNGIVVRGLSKRFTSIEAVRGLDLRIAPGEIYGLVGPDGAGKTTTLRMIAGLSRPSSGEIWIQSTQATHRLAVVDYIGYMPQHFGLYADLTVAENLDFFGDLRGLARWARRRRGKQLLAMTRLDLFQDRTAGKLSGGMKQKLALCCSLLHEPAVLILDEPTNGVDPVSRRDFWKLLRALSQRGLTILLATAYMDEAERCNRVGLMSEGRLIAQAAPDDLINQYSHRCFEIRGPDRQALSAAVSRLQDSTLVQSARRDLVFLPPGQNRQSLEAELLRRGFVVKITSSHPSFEDLFVLIGLEEKRRASA